MDRLLTRTVGSRRAGAFGVIAYLDSKERPVETVGDVAGGN